MEKQNPQNSRILTHRVITLLDRKELEFLDKLGKDAMFSTGHKLSYNEILKGLLEFAIDIGLSGENLDSLKTLKERLLKKMGNGLEEGLDKTDNKTEDKQED